MTFICTCANPNYELAYTLDISAQYPGQLATIPWQLATVELSRVGCLSDSSSHFFPSWFLDLKSLILDEIVILCIPYYSINTVMTGNMEIVSIFRAVLENKDDFPCACNKDPHKNLFSDKPKAYDYDRRITSRF